MINWIKKIIFFIRRMIKGNTGFKDYEHEELFQSYDVKNAKPCPFCGSERIASYKKIILTPFFEEKEWHFLVCKQAGCAARTSNFPEKESAIKAWNKRVED